MITLRLATIINWQILITIIYRLGVSFILQSTTYIFEYYHWLFLWLLSSDVMQWSACYCYWHVLFVVLVLIFVFIIILCLLFILNLPTTTIINIIINIILHKWQCLYNLRPLPTTLNSLLSLHHAVVALMKGQLLYA